MVPAGWLCGSEGKGLRKKQWTLFTLMPDTSCSSFLYSTDAFQAATPSAGAQRQWVWVGGSMCEFFKRNFLGLQKFLPLTQPLLVLVARSFGDLSSWHWNLSLGNLMWGWEPLLLRYPSPNFIHHTWVWDQPVPHLHLFYQFGFMWFI